jgi:hypothetical protein
LRDRARSAASSRTVCWAARAASCRKLEHDLLRARAGPAGRSSRISLRARPRSAASGAGLHSELEHVLLRAEQVPIQSSSTICRESSRTSFRPRARSAASSSRLTPRSAHSAALRAGSCSELEHDLLRIEQDLIQTSSTIC